MLKRERNINSVIHDQLLGRISEEDKKRLQLWLECSRENRESYERLIQESHLSDRFRQYSKVDEERAWSAFQHKHFVIRSFNWKKAMSYAAVLTICLFSAALYFLKANQEGRTTISHETRVAMIRSERMGKQKATLVLPNGQKVKLQASLTRPLQDSLIQPVQIAMSKEQKEKVKTNDNNKLFTYNDSEYWVTFEDGTRVHLNYNTVLKYPSHFSDSNRTVYLDGEAYFEVTKDSNRPFLVVTADGTIKQCGTSFNVDTHAEGATQVVLVEGSISVIPKLSGGVEYKMKPGELAVFQSVKQDIQLSRVDVESYVAWNKGRFVFDNCSLEKLMTVISRWYGKNVIFESEDIKSLRFTGDMDRYNSIIPVVVAIRRVTGLEIKVMEQDILIKKP